ncbi:hypothetical protein NHH03_22420 [Stieleria sp. TO1_6]|nr:hypothetical protein [Stieleria tagensis]
MQSFKVAAGVFVEVCEVNQRNWRSFKTTKENRFNEPISRTRSTVLFRSGRWMMRVKPDFVQMHNGLRWVRMK